MSKQLYPKPQHPKPKRPKASANPFNHPYHVYYEDPSGELEGEWKHYDSETAVKADAFYQCRVLGFRSKATLFTSDEFNQNALGPATDE